MKITLSCKHNAAVDEVEEVGSALFFEPWQAKLVHFHRQLKQVVETLALGLCFRNSVTPNITNKVSTGELAGDHALTFHAS